jgi:hypothetical protein
VVAVAVAQATQLTVVAVAVQFFMTSSPLFQQPHTRLLSAQVAPQVAQQLLRQIGRSHF